MDRGWGNSKLLLLVIAFLSIVFTLNSAYAEPSDSSAELTIHEKIKWLETNYSSTGTAVIQVVYANMNFDPKAVDSFDVDVWSDTDFAGIDLTVTETGDATGIFEGTVFFSTTDDTSGHRLRLSQGDTIYSKFDGYALHESIDVDKNNLVSTASIHGADIFIEDRVSLDKKSYAWNDKVIITINAPEENFDANSIETIDSSKDLIKMYTRHFDIDNYNLVETGINSGIFSGEIILAGEFDNIDSDGITVSFEYEEDVTAMGSAPIVLNPEFKSVLDDSCGVDTVSVDGVCQVVKVEKTKTVGDDAPFFGIFVYLDELFSWIMGMISTDNASTPTSDNSQFWDNSHAFSGRDDMTFYVKWCSQTEGVWIDSSCHFKNKEMFDKANLILDESYKSKITGATAKNVCTILEIPCPDEPVFDASFNPHDNISGFSYMKGDIQYTFNVRDDEIKYKIEEDSQWMMFGDPSNHERFSRITDVSKKISEFDDTPLIVTNEPTKPNEVIKSITLDNVPYGELVENESEYVGSMLHYYGKISDVDRNSFTDSTAKIAVTPAAGWVDLIELTYNKFQLTDDSFKEVWGMYMGVNEDTGLPMLQVFLIE